MAVGRWVLQGRAIWPVVLCALGGLVIEQESETNEEPHDKKTSRKKNKFPCTTCDQYSPSRSALERHGRTHSNEFLFVCARPTCKDAFRNADQRIVRDSHRQAGFIFEHRADLA